MNTSFGSNFPISNTLETIDFINSGKMLQVPTLQCLVEPDNSVLTKTSLFKKCSMDLCGPPSKVPNVWVIDANFSEAVTPAALNRAKKLTPLINSMLDIAKKRRIKDLQIMRTLLTQTESSLQKFDDLQLSDLANRFFEKYIKIKINPSKSLAERIIIEVDVPSGESDILREALENHKTKLLKQLMSNPSYFEFQQAFKEEELHLVAQNTLAELKNEAGSRNIEFELDPAVVSGKSILSKVPFDRYAYFQFREKMNTFTEKSLKQKITQNTCTVPACIKSYIEYFSSSSVKEKIDNYEKSVFDPKVRQRSINRCQAHVIASELQATSQEKAQRLFDEARDRYLKILLPQYSAHSQKLIKDFLINKLSANHKNVRVKYKAGDAFRKFESDASDFVAFDRSVIEFSQSGQHFGKVMDIASSEEALYPFDDVLPCSVTGSNSWDSFYPAYSYRKMISQAEIKKAKEYGENDLVFVSDFSCQHADHGLHNVSHEIGHALNSIFANFEMSKKSAEKYNKMRTCVAKTFPGENVSYTFMARPGDKVTTEESTADALAFFVLNDQKKIFSCALLKPSLMEDSYQELSFENKTDSTSLHPASLSRALLEAFYKDIDLPSSCQELIKIEKPKLSFNKCI